MLVLDEKMRQEKKLSFEGNDDKNIYTDKDNNI